MWTAVTADDVHKLITSACNKTCQSDPVPRWLVKKCGRQLSPFIARLFNASLTTGCFPAKFKHAIVLPLLKKHGLDKDQLKNYRPVSNLPFLSKLVEKVVQMQLQRFLTAHSMMPLHQSAYRRNHSTETVLLKVFSDLQMAKDRGQVSALCLLDLTAAFDTVDHELLLRRLQRILLEFVAVLWHGLSPICLVGRTVWWSTA